MVVVVRVSVIWPEIGVYIGVSERRNGVSCCRLVYMRPYIFA